MKGWDATGATKSTGQARQGKAGQNNNSLTYLIHRAVPHIQARPKQVAPQLQQLVCIAPRRDNEPRFHGKKAAGSGGPVCLLAACVALGAGAGGLAAERPARAIV